jgi:NTP pyrophosphatase (non-canonical NTP hydrolase)
MGLGERIKMNMEKNVVDARIDELHSLINLYSHEMPDIIKEYVQKRISELESIRVESRDSILTSVIRSHKSICAAKNMDEKAAYGQDPAVYYSLGICGEAGELANNVVKSLRNGWDRERILEAVKGELPDVIIYSYVLAYVLDIDLTELVNEKVEIVINRANSGYYGGEIKAS